MLPRHVKNDAVGNYLEVNRARRGDTALVL